MADSVDTKPQKKAYKPRGRFVWRGKDGHILAVLTDSNELLIQDVRHAAEHPDELDFWVKTAASAAGDPVPLDEFD